MKRLNRVELRSLIKEVLGPESGAQVRIGQVREDEDGERYKIIGFNEDVDMDNPDGDVIVQYDNGLTRDHELAIIQDDILITDSDGMTFEDFEKNMGW